MLSYLQSQLFSVQKQENFSIQSQCFQRVLNELQNDNSTISKQILQYQSKIDNLPLQLKRKIRKYQEKLKNQAQSSNAKKQNINEDEQEFFSPPDSPTIFSSAIDKNMLEQKLKNLQEQQQQIIYISRLGGMYIRCKKQQPTYNKSMVVQSKSDELGLQQDNIRDHLNHKKSILEKQELENISQFIQSIQLYERQIQNVDDNQSSSLINLLVSNIRQHTGKKLIQKCENLVHYGSNSNFEKIIIKNYLIKSCKSIILGNQQILNNDTQSIQKAQQIIGKFIQTILGQVLYYDVSYQKIILMRITKSLQYKSTYQEIITRKRMLFLPTESSKHCEDIKISLKEHLNKVEDLKHLLFKTQSNHKQSIFQNSFDKTLQKYIFEIKANLEYILPYLNIKSRKQIMTILTHGKGETMQFQDLVLRLKFKGQDGQMFMNNIDAVFSRLIQIKLQQQKDSHISSQKAYFIDKNFQTLISFFELGIFQAQQSLFQTSSKALSKLTTNFTMRGNMRKSQEQQITSTVNSKKLFNMIFFSVSTFIEKFDELIDKNPYLFSCQQKNFDYQQKITEWITKLVELRQNVRKKVHMQ